MIQDLQDAKMGDPRRLAHIMKRIKDGRTVYNIDEQYQLSEMYHAYVHGAVGIIPHALVQTAYLISDLRYISLS